ncbi:DNA-directed RNA polymerase subunit H [Candidatus Micrarchaeota archaeon]|nr:DNA-directed RNA polymerase subunit H [Candidatus Micrarchaeota archaeon]
MDSYFTHILGPKIVVATDKEVDELLKQLKTATDKLPLIRADDPALPDRAGVGDVVKVLRKSPVTGKEEPYYRLVVD